MNPNPNTKRIACSIMTLTLMAALCGVRGDAAPATRVKKNAAVKRAVADVPRERVVREFKAAYQSPAGSSMVRAYHTGKFRRGFRTIGEQRVPIQVHMVALEVKLTDCGIMMRDTWEVYFYRLETDWIFDGFLQIASKQLTWPKKKHPALDAAAAHKLLADGITRQYPDAAVRGVTVLEKKAAWRLCTPQFRVKSKVLLDLRDAVYNTVTVYECLAASVLSYRDGAWTHDSSGCLYRGKEVPDCHIGTMCRQLALESAIPPVTDAQALSLLRTAFGNEYGLKKNNIEIEDFAVIARQPAENFGKKVPVVMRASFVIDEMKESFGAARSAAPVRAAYECVVYGSLDYSPDRGGWTGTIDSCCSPETGPCGTSCSAPVKGCRRLGEK